MKLNSNLLFAVVAFTGVAVATFKLVGIATAKAAKPSPVAVDPVARGEYLVHLGGCTDCHTPKRMTDMGPVDDLELYLSGHPAAANLPAPPDLSETPWFAATAGMTAWTGPWGISYAANITPDENTGIGIWTEDMFRRAMRTGKHMGDGREILPPMPWAALAKLTDEDLNAMFAYLRTVPAIRNDVPRPVPPTGALIVE